MMIAAMKQALEALEWMYGGEPCNTEAAITAIRSAITEAEKCEPVGYIDAEQLRRWDVLRGTEYEVAERCYMPWSRVPFRSDVTDCSLPVFICPPVTQQEPVVDLINAPRDRYWHRYTTPQPCPRCAELEAKLKEQSLWYLARDTEAHELANRCAEYAKDILRLVETVKYLRGIAERGTGNECPPDETVEQFVLGYVKQLEARCAELEGIAEYHSDAFKRAHDEAVGFKKKVAELEAENAELRRDAERYRWLRDTLAWDEKLDVIICMRRFDEWDAAIDAAMKEETK